MNDKRNYPVYEKVEELRKNLLKDKTIVDVKDFGAGSSIHKTNKRNISAIAVNSVKSKKYGQLLFRMVKYYKPQHILELGTSLGVTTSYLSFGNPDAKIITLEGAESLVTIAQNNFKQLSISNIEQVKGNFDETLEAVIEKMPSIDLAFIDGNHRKKATEKYFQLILSKIQENSVLIFDDIHWSREMEETWDEIRDHSSVHCSIDLFFMGILFFNPSFIEKQHFRIRF